MKRAGGHSGPVYSRGGGGQGKRRSLALAQAPASGHSRMSSVPRFVLPSGQYQHIPFAAIAPRTPGGEGVMVNMAPNAPSSHPQIAPGTVHGEQAVNIQALLPPSPQKEIITEVAPSTSQLQLQLLSRGRKKAIVVQYLARAAVRPAGLKVISRPHPSGLCHRNAAPRSHHGYQATARASAA